MSDDVGFIVAKPCCRQPERYKDGLFKYIEDYSCAKCRNHFRAKQNFNSFIDSLSVEWLFCDNCYGEVILQCTVSLRNCGIISEVIFSE